MPVEIKKPQESCLSFSFLDRVLLHFCTHLFIYNRESIIKCVIKLIRIIRFYDPILDRRSYTSNEMVSWLRRRLLCSKSILMQHIPPQTPQVFHSNISSHGIPITVSGVVVVVCWSWQKKCSSRCGIAGTFYSATTIHSMKWSQSAVHVSLFPRQTRHPPYHPHPWPLDS